MQLRQGVALITFTVPGQPVPKGRPRFGKGRTYTPLKTREAELAVAWEFKRAAGTHWAPLRGEIGLRMEFRCHGRRFDLDNAVKTVMDGLNEVAYINDRQVTRLEARVIEVGSVSACKSIISVIPFGG